MTTYEWFTSGQAVLMTLASLLVFIAYRAFKGGQWIAGVAARMEAIETRVDSVDRRMDRAGKQMSDFASNLQGLPERLRKDFVTRERLEDLLTESRNDRAALWTHVQKLEDR